MTSNSKIFLFLFALILSSNFNSTAQENIAPILHHPHVKKSNDLRHSTFRTTALTLPFFEDFADYNADPDSSKWQDRQVYINNTMGANMISRGVATFDALSQHGIPYDTTDASTLRYADSLTLKVLDLSGFSPADSVYLSFFYQPGGNGFAPEKQDSLLLFFKPKVGSNWIKVWSKSDSTTQEFKQVMIPISDTNFLHNNFQFRFINKASVGINDDVWNVDYIRLSAGRNKFDTVINDLAFTLNPSTILADYTSMPYRQYLANVGLERATTFQSTIKNNYNSSQNISNFGYKATEIAGGTNIGSAADVNRNIPSKSTSNIVFNTYSSTPSAGFYDKVIFENKYYLESSDANKQNDTITGQQIFDNYLAYDDGTAEFSYYLNLSSTLPGKIAIEHHLNRADTLRGMSVYFGRQIPLASYKFFTIVVYKTIAYGSSSADNIIYKIENLKPSYVDTVNHFWVYKFDKPIPMTTGTFYIGTTQPALSGSDSLYFGFDRNRTSGNHAYFNVSNVWSPSLVGGALMMRPILGAPISGTFIKEESIVTFQGFDLHPNPASNTLNISLEQVSSDATFQIRNLLGTVLLAGSIPTKEQSIDISSLPAGLYLLQLIASGELYQSKKFLKQ